MKLYKVSSFCIFLFLAGCQTTPKNNGVQDPNNIVKLNLQFPLDNAETSNDSVLKALESVVSMNQKDAMSWGLLAKAYYDKGYYTKAVRAANEAVNLDANNIEAKKVALLSAVRLAESKLAVLKASRKFDQESRDEVQTEIFKLTQALSQ